MNNFSVLKKVCIIGANGCIGTFMHDLLSLKASEMILIDTAYTESIGNKYNNDITKMSNSMKSTIFSDITVIIFAVSTEKFLELFQNILPFLPHNTVVVDTTSTKCKVETYYEKILQTHPAKLSILSLDPLFKPGIFLSTKPVAYFTKNETKESRELLTILINLGLDLFESSAQEHDAALSIVQVTVHALSLVFGKVMLESDISFNILSKYATPPFRLIMLLLHRIITGTSDVYWDIQYNNFKGQEARNQLKNSLNYFSNLIDTAQHEEFSSLIMSIKDHVGIMCYQDNLSETFNAINKLLEFYFKKNTP